MQNSYRFPQPNNYVVSSVYNWQLGFIADGKILQCENLNHLLVHGGAVELISISSYLSSKHIEIIWMSQIYGDTQRGFTDD